MSNYEDCMLYAGYKNHRGYPSVGIQGKRYGMHRLMYEAFKQEIPSGLEIDHLCRIPPCINPDHLEAVTHVENMSRVFKIAICRKGHSLEDNYYSQGINPSSGNPNRQCKTCHDNRTILNRQRVEDLQNG